MTEKDAVWLNAANQQSLYVGSEKQKRTLDEHFQSFCDGQLHPNIRALPLSELGLAKIEALCEPVVFIDAPKANEAEPGIAHFILQHRTSGRANWCLYDLDDQYNQDDRFPKARSQKIIIGAEITSTPQNGLIMQELTREGWSLSGWRPSQVACGGLCVVMARTHL